MIDIGYGDPIQPVRFKKGDLTAIPLVLPEVYCYYSEGLLLVNTTHMTLSTGDQRYTYQVDATHVDNRVGTASTDVYVVDREVLTVFLREIKTDPDLAQLPRTSVYQDVTLEGYSPPNPNFDGASYTYRWEVWKKQSGRNFMGFFEKN